MSSTIAFKFEGPVWFLGGVTAIGAALGAAFPMSIGLVKNPTPNTRAYSASMGAFASLAGVMGASLVVAAALASYSPAKSEDED